MRALHFQRNPGLHGLQAHHCSRSAAGIYMDLLFGITAEHISSSEAAKKSSQWTKRKDSSWSVNYKNLMTIIGTIWLHSWGKFIVSYLIKPLCKYSCLIHLILEGSIQVIFQSECLSKCSFKLMIWNQLL